MKTIKQIADELNIDKQKVYRYIKSQGIKEVHQEVHQKNNVKYYDDVAENLIKQGLSDKSNTSGTEENVHQNHINDTLLKQIEVLQNELEIKNNQIESLTRLLDQQQHLCAISEKKIAELEDKQNQDKKKWWQIWK